ncbi:hypothetical protein GGF32_007176 [Allomyces javanicus]|nr:hypothetical protein GGF32_007176 [Allomyces javanicus]
MDAGPPPAPPPALAPVPRPPPSRRARTTTMPDVPVAALLRLATSAPTTNSPPSPSSASGTSTRSLHAMVARALAAVVSPRPPSPPSSLRRGRTTSRRPAAARGKRRGDPDARPASRRRRTRTAPAATVSVEHSESGSDDDDENVDGMDIDDDTCGVPVIRVDSGTLAEWTAAPGGLSAPPNSPLSASPPANLLSSGVSARASGYPSPPAACALSSPAPALTSPRAPCSPPYSPRAHVRHAATPAVLARAAAHGHVGKRVGPAHSPEGLAAAAKRRARVRQAMARLAQDLEGVHLVDEQESAPPPPSSAAPGGVQW